MERRASDFERIIGAAHATRALIARHTATARAQMAGGEKSSVNDVDMKPCSKTTIQQLKRKGLDRIDGSKPKAP